MSIPNNAITFLVPGEAELDAGGTVREVRVQAALRDGSVATHRLVAVPGQHAVQISVRDAGGNTLQLVLHPQNARDLLASQQQPGQPPAASRAAHAASNAAAPSDGEVLVPVQARWQLPASLAAADGTPGQRSLFGDLVFGALKLIGLDVYGAAVGATAQQVIKWRDDSVTEGVYRLKRDRLASLKGTATTLLDRTAQAQLVLIHGTAVDTTSTFGKWWDEHPGVIRQVFDAYQDQVYALDHATLGRSPIFNALTLARALPANAKLHLVTHSRGGLVAEVLVRACAGIGDTDLAFFADVNATADGRNYSAYRSELAALRNELRGKNISVQRVVRVACPAHGTYLASGRLDAYFSVLAFLLERAIGPLGDDMAKFLQAVASRRMDPSELPGLESMVPGRPMALWLNRPGAAVNGDLRVVAGDVEPSLLEAWIRTLVAYAVHPLFMGDNDLVVNTSAMYGGAVRSGPALFLLDRSPHTDHFHYFSNDSTANGVGNALLLESPPDFAPIGPLSAAGQDSTGLRELRAPRVALADDGKRPAVVVLPGILGSNLKSAEQREWFVLLRMLGLIDRIQWGDDGSGIEQDGPMEAYYGDLMDYLGESHHVEPFGYDWRAPLEASAARLADLLKTLLAQRDNSQQPVRLLAHSMGGMVVRVMMLRHPEVWQQLLAHPDARLVMLGTPNGGSWAPMSIYTGDDRFGRLLASLNGLFNDHASRQKMAGFEGLLQLAAGLQDPQYKLANSAVWQQLAALDQAANTGGPWHDSLEATERKSFYQWAIPESAALTRAASLRKELDAQALALGDAAARMALVLGESDATPCGLASDPQQGVDYLYTAEGDSRVTWASACLPGVRSWKVGFAHGDLPKATRHFAAYLQLLQGVARPDLPEYLPAAPRGAAAQAAVSWRGRLRDAADPGLVDQSSLLDAAMGAATVAPLGLVPRLPISAPLRVQVTHGDLKFVQEPLLLGHSSSLALSGSEAAVNRIMGHALDDALKAGLYPDRVGEHQVFVKTQEDSANPWGLKRPVAVVVAGLGNETELKPGLLRLTVRRAVLAYAQHAAQAAADQGQPAPTSLRLAMTSIGSGSALSVGDAVSAAVQGVLEANEAIASGQQHRPWPQVAELCFIELYLNRATEAWHTLNDATNSRALNISLDSSLLEGHGGQRKPAGLSYRGASYDLVRVTQGGTPNDTLEYALYTSRARSEVRYQQTQRPLVDQLIAMAEGNPRHDAALARSLHRLLIPQELRAYLGNAGNLVLELDQQTARYPWELLDDSEPDQGQASHEWAVGARSQGALVRRLRVGEYRRAPADSLSNEVLVIGMSNLLMFQHIALNPLPAVASEVDAVQTALSDAGLQVTTLLDRRFDEGVKALLTRSWKAVHLSGHGIRLESGLTGMLISQDAVLGPAEFNAMDIVPELVFVNCCHLGKIEAGAAQTSHGAFAASVAGQLISDGVRCVVAAGWAVDDDAARAFAQTFYAVLGTGSNFGHAVQAAREAARQANSASNTWAAYHCYGDLNWQLYPQKDGVQAPMATSAAAAVATPDELLLQLERISLDASDADNKKRDALQDELKRIGALRTSPYQQWLANGAVAEALAEAWKNLNQQEQAIRWYGIAISASDGGASLRAREQQLKLRARLPDASLKDLHAVVLDLVALIELAPTAERWRILGSAYKRAAVRAVVELPGKREFLIARLTQMRDAYAQAASVTPGVAFYPALQNLQARLRLHWMDKTFAAPAAHEISDLRALVRLNEQRDGADFCSTVTQPELDLIEALLRGTLPAQAAAIASQFAAVHRRVGQPQLWKSVADSAGFGLINQTGAKASRQNRVGRDLRAQLEGYAGLRP